MLFCGAFSPDIRIQIKERAGNKSELSGDSDRPLQCSHFFHNEKHPSYDESKMGILVTDIEHLMYHVRYLRNPERIGLDGKENKGAIKTLWWNILLFNNCDLQEIVEKGFEAEERWAEFFDKIENFSDNPNSKQAVPPLSGI